jgi:hypothetical protein
VVLDENASLETLRRLPVVLLPNAAILSEAEVGLLRSYVEGGGHLIVTGATGTLGRMGHPLGKSMLADLIGARLVRKLDSLDNWVKLPASDDASARALGEGIPADWAFLVKGPAVVYQPTTARPLGELWRPSRTRRQQEGKEPADWPMSPEERVGPAVLLNTVGRGQVLTLAASADYATGSEHAITEARRLLANAVRLLHPVPRVRITAPVSVEAVVTDDPAERTLRVHLLGYQSPPQTTPATNRPYVVPAPIEELPLFRATIAFSGPVKSAHAFNASTQLRRRGRVVQVLVEDVHDVIVLKY